MSELSNKVANATKWSAFAEIIGKIIAPISTMVLARVLTPEAFGVVTTLTMVITFAEIFTDAGFQRYIIQHDFFDDEDRDKTTNVAFWINLILSIFLWLLIAFYSEPIATIVGSPGLGNVLIWACVSIPLSAFSSIQMAVFKRSLDFKSLFYRRLISVFIPIFITIPLALWLRSYWALVFGTIAVNLSNAIILTIMSPWKPRLYFSIRRLKDMFSYSIWSMLDAILVWCTFNIEIFFIGRMLSSYYLGIYKTSMTTVGQFTSVITAAILPVLMPAFSRAQGNYNEMRDMLFKIQKYLSVLLLPLGFGIFIFSGLITKIMLGNQWLEAVPYIGFWALIEVITIIFSRFCSNIFPAIGKPRISVALQVSHLVILIPIVYYSIQFGFSVLFYTRTLLRLELVILNVLFAYICIKVSPLKMIINVWHEFFACIVMTIVGICLLQLSDSIVIQFIWIFVCVLIYFLSLFVFKEERIMLRTLKYRYLIPILDKWK